MRGVIVVGSERHRRVLVVRPTLRYRGTWPACLAIRHVSRPKLSGTLDSQCTSTVQIDFGRPCRHLVRSVALPISRRTLFSRPCTPPASSYYAELIRGEWRTGSCCFFVSRFERIQISIRRKPPSGHSFDRHPDHAVADAQCAPSNSSRLTRLDSSRALETRRSLPRRSK